MISYALAEAADAIVAAGGSAEYSGDVRFYGLGTDSRNIQAGQLFVALKGPNFDGHAFVRAALEQGASAVLTEHCLPISIPQLRVSDTLLALGHLSKAWRARFTLPVFALTGSNGKTTVKEMLAAIFRQYGKVLATQGNLNNQIGVPLMLARLSAEYDFAVFELGANHVGEIAYLTALVKPDIALINNAGPAHLEGFGDLDGVARAKGEIYQGLGADGIALINADDDYATYWRELNTERRIIDFGFHPEAAVRGEVLPTTSGNQLRIWLGEEYIDMALNIPGEHNQRNALAAAAAAWAAGLSSNLIQAGLQTVRSVQGRMQMLAGVHGCTLINDTYNANPGSLLAGLRALPAASERWLVLGDMAELGATANAIHAQAGRDIQTSGVSRLFTFGELSRNTSQAFGAGGAHFTTLPELVDALRSELLSMTRPAPIILVKGSRSMQMERVVEMLLTSAPTESRVC